MSSHPNRRNHYRVLHVQPEAPLEVIKASYRTLMMRMRLHPDLGGDHERAAVVNEAYAVLSDPLRRAEYDRQLRLRSPPELMRRRTAADSPSAPSPPCAEAPSTGPAPCAAPSPMAAPTSEVYTRSTGTSLTASARLSCAFCRADQSVVRSAAPLCARCGAPLTPVRQVLLPNFGSLGHNRRQSVRRPRQAEAVAYWGLPPQRHRVLWRDLSAGGLSVWSSQPAAVGQRVLVIDPDLQTVVEVVACELKERSSWLIRARLLTLRTAGQAGLFCSAQA